MRPQRSIISKMVLALSPVLRALRSHPAPLLRNRASFAEVSFPLLWLFFKLQERCVVVRVEKWACDLARSIGIISGVFIVFVQSQQWVCCCTKHGGCNNSRDDWKVGWVAWLILPRHHYPGVTMLVGWTNVLHEQNRALFYVASRFLSVGIWIKNVEIKEVIILWVDLLVLLLAEKVMHFIFARLKKANLYSKCLEMWNLILTALASKSSSLYCCRESPEKQHGQHSGEPGVKSPS